MFLTLDTRQAVLSMRVLIFCCKEEGIFYFIMSTFDISTFISYVNFFLKKLIRLFMCRSGNDEDIEILKNMPRGLPHLYFFWHPKGIKGCTAGQKFGENTFTKNGRC